MIMSVSLGKGVTSVMICALNSRSFNCHCSVHFSDNSTNAAPNRVLVTEEWFALLFVQIIYIKIMGCSVCYILFCIN